ncbi:MAG: asparagine synthetase B [Pirellulales bacterium]
MSEILAALHFGPSELGDSSFELTLPLSEKQPGGLSRGSVWAPHASDWHGVRQSPGASKTLVCGDLRIDNREGLCRRLSDRRPSVSSTATDNEVVVACYQRWGTAAFELLEGDFAFVLWDGGRNRLYCVRDALGMRCVFYHQDPRRLLIASSIQPLFDSDAGLERRLSRRSVGAYLAGQRPAPDETFYSGIHRLPAGHWLEATSTGDVRTVRFWDPTRIPLTQHQSANDYADDFRGRFLDSVRGRLRTASPTIGLHVSGGFDSSAVTAATHYWNERLDLGIQTCAFTNIGQDPDADERRYIDEVLARFPMSRTDTSSEDFWAFRPASGPPIARAEPYLAPYHARFVYELETARRLGIQVILSGAGGDEIGGSSMYLIDSVLHGRILCFWPELKARAAGKHQSAGELLKTLLRALASWLVHRAVEKPKEMPAWLNRKFAREVRGQLCRDSRAPIRRSPAREHLFRSLEFCWTEPLLSESHEIARRFGVEVRHPFLDRRLFEWALSVPPYRFGENGCVKAPLRRALGDMLPKAILNRPDKGRYGHYFDLGLREKERPRILEFLRDPISAELGFVEPRKLRFAFDQYCRGGKINRAHLWNWVTLEQWLRELHQCP